MGKQRYHGRNKLNRRRHVFTGRDCPSQLFSIIENDRILTIRQRQLDASRALRSSLGMMYHALIRTHHITSRKKVATLKAAAKKLNCYALLRSGGVPGVMYVESDTEQTTQSWVDTVHDLRYKDYQLVAPTSAAGKRAQASSEHGILREVDTVKGFAAEMETKGLLTWWRTAMGFTNNT